MKRIFIIVIAISSVLICTSTIAQALFSVETFDIKIIESNDCTLQPIIPSETQSYQYRLVSDGNTYEVRYLVFKYTGKADEDILSIKQSAKIWFTTILLNIGGGSKIPPQKSFNDKDVKAEFNGDFGATCF